MGVAAPSPSILTFQVAFLVTSYFRKNLIHHHDETLLIPHAKWKIAPEKRLNSLYSTSMTLGGRGEYMYILLYTCRIFFLYAFFPASLNGYFFLLRKNPFKTCIFFAALVFLKARDAIPIEQDSNV